MAFAFEVGVPGFIPFKAEADSADDPFNPGADAGMFDVEEVGKTGHFALGIADDDDAVVVGKGGEFLEGIFRLGIEALEAFAGEADRKLAAGIGSAFAAELIDFRPGAGLDEFEDGLRGIDAAGVAEAVEVAPGLLLDFQRLDEPDDGVGREVIQEIGGLIDGPGGAVAESDEAGVLEGGGGAKGLDIEGGKGFDLIAEEIDADGVFVAGRPDVDDFTADGKIAGVFDGIEAGIAMIGEPANKTVAVEGLAGGETDELIL